jgi:hypothetical protein
MAYLLGSIRGVEPWGNGVAVSIALQRAGRVTFAVRAIVRAAWFVGAIVVCGESYARAVSGV